MSYRNRHGVGSRHRPRLGERTIGRSNLGWGGEKRPSRPNGGTSIVMVPVTNDKRIIFPYSTVHYKFDSRYYKPEHSNNQMAPEEAASILNQLDIMIAPARQNWGQGYIQCAGVLTFLTCMAFLISVPVTLVALDINFPIPIVVTAIIFGACLALLFFTYCFVNGKRASILNDCVKTIQAFLDQHADSFKARNLTWVIPEHFPWWIEVWKGEVVKDPQRPDNGTYTLMTKQAGPKTTQVPQQVFEQPGQDYNQDYSQNHFVGTQSSFRTPDQMGGGFTMSSNNGGGYTMSNQGGGFSTQPRQGGGFMMSSGRTHPL